jgi:hypothetical protein
MTPLVKSLLVSADEVSRPQTWLPGSKTASPVRSFVSPSAALSTFIAAS